MKGITVSIIVPIYNTEKYLGKCVNSILKQTYENLEVILVNDGSPDNALESCREYESSDSRVKVINKENGGLSSARNAGLDICTGEYIAFVDSDDYLEKDAIETLLGVVDQKQIDIAVMKMKPVDKKYNLLIEYNNDYGCKEMSCKKYLEGIFERKKSCSVCDKLFSAKFWGDRRFESGRLNEDFLLLSKMFLDEECIVAEINYYGYNYYTRSASISRNGFGAANRDAVYNAKYILKYTMKNSEELIAYAGAYVAYQTRTALAIMSIEDFRKNQEFVCECNQCLKDTKKYILGSFMEMRDRVFCLLFPVAPKLFFLIMKIIRKR